MRYVISGATSATGNSVTQQLIDRIGVGNIVCITRSTSNVDPLQRMGVRYITGDVNDSSTMESVLEPSDTYIDMTHPKYYPVTVPLVKASGVKRVYFITTTGIFSKYHHCSDIYKVGEGLIAESGLEYTILRPSMIYGSDRDRNMSRLIRFLSRTPVFPLFGGGASKMQPVHYEDLATGIVSAILHPGSVNKAYNLAGPEPLTYRELVTAILDQLKRKALLVPVPTGPAYLAVQAMQWIPRFPINGEQVQRLREDKAFDISAAVNDLGYRPRSFVTGIAEEVALLRKAGVI